jgi:hypothetical protein
MDYTDCNDFLWPIEIFGLKLLASAFIPCQLISPVNLTHHNINRAQYSDQICYHHSF